MKLIPLIGKHGNGKFAIVDNEDYGKLMEWKWAVKVSRKRLYAYRNSTIQSTSEMRLEGRKTRKSQKTYMHRVLLGLEPGSFLQGDHIDGNSLNNQKANLRAITLAQNRQNELPIRGGYSQHRGVSYDKARRKWIANSCLDSKRVNLGRYGTEEDAHQAVVAWRKTNMPYSTDS